MYRPIRWTLLLHDRTSSDADSDSSSHSGCHLCCIGTHHTSSKDHYFGRSYSGYTSE